MFLIRTDTGLRFSAYLGWGLSTHSRFINAFEARRIFEKNHVWPEVSDPRYFIVKEETGEIVDELKC